MRATGQVDKVYTHIYKYIYQASKGRARLSTVRVLAGEVVQNVSRWDRKK